MKMIEKASASIQGSGNAKALRLYRAGRHFRIFEEH